MTNILLLLLACDFSASTTVKTDDTGSPTSNDTALTDTAPTEPEDTGAPAHPSDVDDDGDGFTENDGDCDDDNIDIHPGVKTDSCDGINNDCDEFTDEDAVDSDSYEPNDDSDYNLGTAGSTPLTAQGQLHNDQDIDRFSFSIPDSWWSSTTVDVLLSGIPAGSAYRLTIEDAQNGQQIYQDFGDIVLTTTISDSLWEWDVSGEFRVTIDAISGADCDTSYTLIVTKD